MTKSIENPPRILDRLKAILGSYGRVTASLGVPPNYATRWTRLGFIPETWALDVHELRVEDEWGAITAMDVLIEARQVRGARIEAAIQTFRSARTQSECCE